MSPLRKSRSDRRLVAAVAALAVAAVIASTGAAPPAATGAPAGSDATAPSGEDTPVEVQVLSLTDFHGYLSDTENQRITGPDGPLDVGGAGYLAAHLDRLRAGHANSFLIGSGDQFSGWPDYTQAFANEPTIEVLNSIGLDFDVAGNHEFDRELPFLQRMVSGDCYGKPGFDSCFTDSTGRDFRGTDYAYHAANIVDDQGESVLPPYWVTTVPDGAGGELEIGFVGLTLPETPEHSLSFGGSNLEFQELVEAADRAAAELTAQGVETIVVSMHEGGQQQGLFDECTNPTGPIFDAARTMSPDVDVILGGHWHTAFSCMIPDPDGNPRPVLEASNHGRLVGEVQLSIDPGTGDVLRERTVATNHPITQDIAPDPEVQGIVRHWMDRWTERQGTPLGRIDDDLAFSTTEESPMGNLAADLYHDEAEDPDNGGADLALVPPEIGIDVVAAGLDFDEGDHPADRDGRVLFGEAWPAVGISPVVTVSLTGAEIDAVLEEQWVAPAYGCRRETSLAVSGNVRYRYDLGAPPGDRIRIDDIRIDGRPVDPDRTYRVATTSILVVDGAHHGYPTIATGREAQRAPRMGQEVFLNHLRTHRRVEAPDVGRAREFPGTPPPVDGPFGPLNLIPQEEMTATATSQGNAAHGAASALDGKCSTMWHSAWSPHAPLPQSITLDLGTARSIEALVYTPRQDADVPNGRIASYDVQVSTDGTTFTSAVTGSWDGTVEAKIARLPAGTEARYVRLVGVEGGANFAAATEINIALADPAPATPPAATPPAATAPAG